MTPPGPPAPAAVDAIDQLTVLVILLCLLTILAVLLDEMGLVRIDAFHGGLLDPGALLR